MKKILSIFMVAVLTLNLLYQPCMAVDAKKEMVSSETQKDTDSECETKANKEDKAKIEEQQSKTVKSKPKTAFLDRICRVFFYTLLFAWILRSAGNKRGGYKAGYKNGFKAGGNKHCAAKQTGDIFPIDKMSKKCLKHTLASLHPDKFECYEDIRNFYVKAQEAYEKMK